LISIERSSTSQKVLFVENVGEDEYETEGIWCSRDGENFVVDNIPFVASRISLGDTIKAEYDADEKAFYFDDFVKASGNTTVRLYFQDISIIEDARSKLVELGCEGEIFLTRKMLAVNVPYDKEYRPIKKLLDEGEQQGKWTYEESCLAHNPSGL
jgi:hypothetical protein